MLKKIGGAIMIKKIFTISLTIALLLTSFVFPSIAADPPSDKSAYFEDGVAVNCTPAEAGSNVLTVISGDVLKIMVSGKADPNFGIQLKDNVDTNTYKILALKVKKTYNPVIGGEIFYNEKAKVQLAENLLLLIMLKEQTINGYMLT